MSLEFNAAPYLQLWQQQQAQQAAQRPDPNAISQNIMQGLQGLAENRRQQQLMDMTKQKTAWDMSNEQQKMALEQRKVDYETGKPISPTAMFEDQPQTNGAGFGWMPGGQGQEPVNPGQGRTLIDAHKEWMANGKPLAGARPEFMDAMGKDERKAFIDQNDPGKAAREAADTNLKNAQADFYRTGKSDALNSAATARQSAEQDRLEAQARQGVENLRGDKSLARAEEQRDAAIIAYNRIHEIEQSGQGINPIDLVDVLGQIYKARTGNAPTEQVLAEAHQQTAQGQLGKVFTYFTGQQAPATSQAILSSLKNMAGSMGMQADKLHEGYMGTHLMKPSGLEDARWQPIAKTGRGTSFQDATGYQPVQRGTQKPMTATNRRTGQKIVSNDGGQTWQAQ